MLIASRSNLALRWLLALLALASPWIARAAPEPGYSIQSFQAEQGLPQANINAIIQSRDGYLWLGAFSGLARFDGVRFRIFDAANTPQLQNSRITALFESDDGAIWIGHETGDLTRLRDGQFEPMPIPGAVEREPILAITTDAQKNLVLVYQNGAARHLQTGAHVATAIPPEQQRGVSTAVRDSSGAIWVLRAGALERIQAGQAQLAEFDRFAADQLILGISAARDGGVWIASGRSLRKRLNNEWTAEMITPFPATAISALLEMRNGILAIATRDQGIHLLSPTLWYPFNREDGLPPDWVRAFYEDREGNLWLALGSGGLVALHPARVAEIRAADRWKGRPVVSVAATRDRSLWIGTEGAGAYRYLQGASRALPITGDHAPPTNSFIWSFAEDTAHHLWISAAENGLYIFDGNKFNSPPGLETFSTPIRVLFQSRSQNAMLLGARTGLYKYADQKIQPLVTNLIAPDIRSLAEQTNGVLWFGLFGGGLGRLENGAATQFRKSQGLGSDFIQALYLDHENTLWIGAAESGLTRYKNGAFASITTAHGLRDNVICHIAEDQHGHLWLSSSAGLMRIAKADLNRVADGLQPTFPCVSLGETDGLPSAQSIGGLQPTGAQTPDGALWFATQKGLVALDPARLRTNQLPATLIEQLRVNDTPVHNANANTNSLTIPPGRQRFDIDYTAISFAAPDRVLFKYRLDPIEPNWIGPTTKRTIAYNHLEPGAYTFHVIASNSDGAWNQTPATLQFTVLPFFWQTLAFRVAIIAASIALVGAAVLLLTRQRYRRQLELAERQRGIERERARIAQDIHDDLGSSLTRIILLSQSARGDLDNPEYAAQDLDRIYDTARTLTRSLDEIVWAVNPRHDTLDSLATYLGKFAQDFLGAANIPCRLNLPVTLPAWPLSAETRHNVFLAFKEALNNTVKHAQATEVRITLTLEKNAFTLSLEDNGRGFTTTTPAEATSTEDGLANMRKRLTDIGGSCQINSTPAQGTRTHFHVPITPV